jgi:hypothetical protein
MQTFIWQQWASSLSSSLFDRLEANEFSMPLLTLPSAAVLIVRVNERRKAEG